MNAPTVGVDAGSRAATDRPGTPIRVVVADDQVLLRSSLARLLDAEPDLSVVAEAADGAEAVAAVRSTRPDVVLMDIRMPHLDGLEATRRICADPEAAGTRIVIVTMFELDEYVYAALRAGAAGFLLKDAPPETLLDAVRRVHAGERLLAPSVLTRLVEHYTASGGGPPAGVDPRSAASASTARGGAAASVGLTPREREVLTLVGRGRSNDEIAADLVISGATVKTHIAHLLAKLAARDRAQLVIAAYEFGLITPRRTHG